MKREDYVSLKQAKALKELGFDWEVVKGYSHFPGEKVKTFNAQEENVNAIYSKWCFAAPSLAQAQKWLREKGIDITPIPITLDDERKYRWALDRLNPRLQDWTDDIINSYEEALSAGIDKALEFLKQETNDNQTK